MKKLLLILVLACSFNLSGQTIDTIAVRSAIERQMATYPETTLQDIYKSFYQEHFGPGHIISDTASARRYLMRELSEMGETCTPYFEKRNIHFYVNRCGFHIVEFWNKYQNGPAIPDEEVGNWHEDDEMFLFRKVMR